jgi:predicted nucleic acid-binding Zn ribbon protein
MTTIDVDKLTERLYEIATQAASKEDALTGMEAFLVAEEIVGIRKCKSCSQVFARATKWQKFCSEKCKLDWHEKRHGKRFDPKLMKRAENELMAVSVGQSAILVKKKPQSTKP